MNMNRSSRYMAIRSCRSFTSRVDNLCITVRTEICLSIKFAVIIPPLASRPGGGYNDGQFRTRMYVCDNFASLQRGCSSTLV